jgi:hypothetical protein
LTLSAKGLLYVSGTDSIATLGLRNVTFASNSKTTFVLGGATSKGNGLSYTAGPPVFAADNVTVSNGGGSVDYTTGSVSAIGMTLTATKGTIIFPANTTLTALQNGGNGGSITLNAQALSYTGPLVLNATGTVDGGNVAVNLTGTTLLNFSSAATNPISVNITNGTGAGGSLQVSNGGALSFDATGVNFGGGWSAGNGASLSLSANGVLTVLQAGNFASLGLHSLTFDSNSKTPFSLGGALPGTNGIVDGGLNITTDNLTISNPLGAIQAGSVLSLTGSNSVLLNALNDIGQSSTPLPLTSTAGLTVTTGTKANAFINAAGSVVIDQAKVGLIFQFEDNATSASNLTLGTAGKGGVVSAGSLNITFTDSNSDNTDVLTINQLNTTAGDLTVTSNAQQMLISPNATINSNLGNITLQNTGTSTTVAPVIQFDAGSRVHGSGATKNMNQGNVTILVGAIPSGFVSGVQPPYPTIDQRGFNCTYGAIGNLTGTITSTDFSDIINCDTRSVHFNTASPTGITLATNVIITADPPPASAPSMIVQSGEAIGASVSTQAVGTQLATTAAPSQLTASINSGTFSAQSNSAVYSSIAAGIVSATTNNSSSLSATAEAVEENSRVPISAPIAGLRASSNLAIPQKDSKVRSPLSGKVSNVRHQTLENGGLLIAPEQAIVVDTNCGTVTVAPGTITFLVASEKGLAVYNLHDNHSGAVVIDTGGRRMILTPGLSALISPNIKQTFEELNPAPYVAYRNLRNSRAGEMSIHQGEFQITSLLHALPTMTKSMAGNEAKKQKALANVLKTAAILTSVMPGSEPFVYRAATPVTACARYAQ